MLWFGRTLWGGALTTGIVSVAGAVTVTASLQGWVEKTTLAEAQPAQAVAQPSASVERIQFVGGAVAGSATPSGAARVEFHPQALAEAVATGSGDARVDFLGAGSAAGVGAAQAEGLRTARARGKPVLATASVSADDPQVLLVAVPLRATGTAIVQGTTGYFAAGSVAAGASASGDGHLIRAATGAVATQTSGTGSARVDGNGAGAATGAATGWGDPYFQRGTVKYFDGNGVATATAMLQAEPYLYSVALAVGRATLSGAAQKITPARGTAVGQATGSGWWQLVVPLTAEAATLQATATGTATVRRLAGGRGTALPAAQASAQAQYILAAGGAVTGQATLQVSALTLAIRAQATAGATGSASVLRIRTVTGAATGAASVSGYNQVNALVRAPATRTLAVSGSDRQLVVGEEPRSYLIAAPGRQYAA